jgi:hypothetical protein
MRTYPYAGHVLSADDVRTILEKLVNEEVIAEFDKEMEEAYNGKEEAVLKTVQNAFGGNGFPIPESTFILNDDAADSGDLACNTIYFCFYDDELYEKRPTRQMEALIKVSDKVPKYHAWTVFG